MEVDVVTTELGKQSIKMWRIMGMKAIQNLSSFDINLTTDTN